MPGARFKDSIQIKGKESAILMTVISLDSALQKGAQWTDFLELVDRCFIEKSISKLIIVTTGHLQRHYFSLGLENPLEEKEIEEKAIAMDQQWLEKQNVSLAKLKIPLEIISWKDLLNLPTTINTSSFEQFSQLIKSDYEKKREFKHLIDKHADGYVTRKILQYCKGKKHFDRNQFHQVAIHYVLEECAALQQIFSCGADFLAYPHGKTPPANYVWNTYFKDESLRYVRYETKSLELKPVPANAHSDFFRTKKEDLPTNCASNYVNWAVKQERWSLPQQYQFIRGVEQLVALVNAQNIQQETAQRISKITHRRSV
ncbi:hypothetical protein [Rickettsiella endosymbiont of Miltochrista miniata]|uniref:hypothetical protein n=1 Tax=Rickettsiella endosymbiont of Miltochrista miniata TaxID=3066239 RepID=UPI00313ED338